MNRNPSVTESLVRLGTLAVALGLAGTAAAE
jgi:hypothetical protein